MEVILLERIDRLGQMGDVVNVKNGYARNYLLPQKKALRSTKENMAYFESMRAELEARNLKLREDAVRAATANPAAALGALDRVGTIAPGKVADFIICRGDYTGKRVFMDGNEIA